MNHACKQASYLASESLDRKLSLSERLRYQLHLFMCHNCRNFRKNLNMIHRITELMRLSDTNKAELSDAMRSRIGDRLVESGCQSDQ